MADFLLELLSEEIPARMQAKAREDLRSLFEAELARAGLAAQAIETYATPRRLALTARGLPEGTQAVSEEIKGPRAAALPQAIDGFLRKTGLARDALVERDGILFARIEKPGRAAASVLAEAIPAVVRAFPWPKSMRWGAASVSTESPHWVRPLQGIVALLGEEIVDFEIAGKRSGAATVGHRFHHPGIITIGGAHDYAEKLRACHVIVDPEERKAVIRDGAAAAAAAAGLALVPDEGLVAENAGLTEWPVPLLGAFDPAFLEVPREVIQLTMRTNQKYFACTKSSPAFAGKGDQPKAGGGAFSEPELAPNFVCIANIEASDGGLGVIAGNERVLSARLADAKFFWEQDVKVPLADQAKKLGQIVFHEKLGTVADKVERVAKLARWLIEEGIVGSTSSPLEGEGRSEGRELGGGQPASSPQKTLSAADAAGPSSPPSPSRGEGVAALAAQAETAARLAKADLVTGLVGEFPELQGVIGGHLALAQGQPDAVADAIRDHYKPVGQGDEVPTAPVTVAVSLADKLDTIASFFGAAMPPSGSKDPFALRRAALGIASIVVKNALRLSMSVVVRNAQAWLLYSGQGLAGSDRQLLDFFIDRLKIQQREAGVRHDLIDAVFALGGEGDLVRLLARVKALQAFVETKEGCDLLAGYKRAANILKKEGWEQSVAPAQAGASGREDAGASPTKMPASAGMTAEKPLSRSPEKEEADLIAALDAAEPAAADAVGREDFEAAMAALATLRAPIDAFFDNVTVNDPDPAKREARLALLARMRDAVHGVADFSKIEG